MTNIVSKQLQPIYNKPMVYYPLTTLIALGIREILLISSPEDIGNFARLLGDGSQWGIRLEYAVQPEPKGIAQALTIGGAFIGDDSVTLILGDNLVYGRLTFMRDAIAENGEGATVFAYQVKDPSAYGVVEIDDENKVISIEEKPAKPKSPWAVPGIYIYGPGVAERATELAPSARGELEITDLNRTYLEERALRACVMGRGVAWFDTGTPENLLAAGTFVHALEERQSLYIGCPEEASYRMGFMDRSRFEKCIETLPNCPYRDYLRRVLEEHLGFARHLRPPQR